MADANDFPLLTLDTVGNGAARELFANELAKVLENIDDPNCEAESKRRITLTFEFRPSADRRDVSIDIQAEAKLVPFNGHSSKAFVGRVGGKMVAKAFNHEQLPLGFGLPGAMSVVASPQPVETQRATGTSPT